MAQAKPVARQFKKAISAANLNKSKEQTNQHRLKRVGDNFIKSYQEKQKLYSSYLLPDNSLLRDQSATELAQSALCNSSDQIRLTVKKPKEPTAVNYQYDPIYNRLPQSQHTPNKTSSFYLAAAFTSRGKNSTSTPVASTPFTRSLHLNQSAQNSNSNAKSVVQ